MRMRKKRHGNERLEALGALFVKEEGEVWTTLPSYYEKDQPLRIEIGCGKGGFITGISLAQPEYNWLAVEKISDVMVCAVEKYAGDKGLGKLGYHGGWQAPDGTVSLDFVGKKSGRGAYVCRKLSCFKKARKAKRFERSLDCEIPEEIYTRMEEEIAESEKGVKADGADK